MAEYTYKDVIIDPEDLRVEIGKEYYFGECPIQALNFANDNGRGAVLSMVDDADNLGPFWFRDIGYSHAKGSPCIIRKKEPEKRYVPFDLSKEKDRAKLRGAWVKAKKDPDKHQNVCGVCSQYVFLSCQAEGYDAEDFLESFTFIDGTPCGKLVEE